MKTHSAMASLARHQEIAKGLVSIRELSDRFGAKPRGSVAALLTEMGPFVPDRHAFRFVNSFTISADQAIQFLEFVSDVIIKELVAAGVAPYRAVLSAMRVNRGSAGYRAAEHHRRTCRQQGRCRVDDPTRLRDCGFQRQEFWSLWRDGFRRIRLLLAALGRPRIWQNPPTEGALGQYIYDRLVDSIGLNIRKFLEWTMIVHVLPKVDEVATAALLAIGGSFAFPIGTFIGALVGSKVDIFNFGGPAGSS